MQRGTPNVTPSAPPVGQPQAGPLFPSFLPAGFQIQKVDVAIPTGGGQTTVKVPTTALAILGFTINPVFANVQHYLANLLVQDNDLSASRTLVLGTFAGFRGTKSSFGFWPVNPSQETVTLNLNAIDTGFTGGAVVFFLVGPTRGVPVQVVPFQPDGNPDGSVVIAVAFTSATTTAQTVDIKNQGQLDYVELVNAWFVAPSGTATGNMGFWDGTTRVDADTTAAAASYIFNQGTKGVQNGPLTTFNSGNANVNLRFVIGAPSAGTSTLYIVYRVRLQR